MYGRPAAPSNGAAGVARGAFVGLAGALPAILRPVTILGAVLGQKYRVIRQIGEGGMGTVWEAEHQLIGRRVAVKTLHLEFAHRLELVQRFQREAQAASRIGHVNIIEVMDFGVGEDGTPYLVMELLDGQSLAVALAREGTLPVPRAVDIIGQILGALAAAHGKGIVHRDLKPENVFLIEFGGRSDFVKLLDFGISKFRTSAGEARLTSTGVTLGTPYYMAPEQAAGRQDLDHRVDIYATGAVLYELLSGRPPYEGNNYNALLAQIVTSPPTPLDTFRPDLDPELVRVIETAMARDRDRRYLSAEAMLAALVPLGASRAPFERCGAGSEGHAPRQPSSSGAARPPAAVEASGQTRPSSRPASAHAPTEAAPSVSKPRGAPFVPAEASAPTRLLDQTPAAKSTTMRTERTSRVRFGAVVGVAAAAVAVAAFFVLRSGPEAVDGSGPAPSVAPAPAAAPNRDAVPAAVRPDSSGAKSLQQVPAADAIVVAPPESPDVPDVVADAGMPPDDVASAAPASPASADAGDAGARLSRDAGRRTADGLRPAAALDARADDAGRVIVGPGGSNVLTTYEEDS
jgi:serine/threonine protein kinase